MNVARVVAQIKFIPIYTCKCGTTKQGDTMNIKIDGYGNTALFGVFDKLQLEPNNMPVGWGSYYAKEGNDFRCPKCIGEKT